MRRFLIALLLCARPAPRAPRSASRTSPRCGANATTSSSATAWWSACRHRRHVAQRPVHRAGDQGDARSHGDQRPRQGPAQSQRRRGDRHRRPARPAWTSAPARRHRFVARRRDLADGRHAAAHPLTGADGNIYATRKARSRSPASTSPVRRRRCRKACRPRGRSPTARSSNADPSAAGRTADDPRTEKSRRHDGGAHRRRGQRLFAAAIPPAVAFEMAPARSSCSGRRRSASPDTWRRSANCRSSPTPSARVVIDSRTGTVVIGQDVQIPRWR